LLRGAHGAGAAGAFALLPPHPPSSLLIHPPLSSSIQRISTPLSTSSSTSVHLIQPPHPTRLFNLRFQTGDIADRGPQVRYPVPSLHFCNTVFPLFTFVTFYPCSRKHAGAQSRLSLSALVSRQPSRQPRAALNSRRRNVRARHALHSDIS
jgi:hypothetical protein